MPKDFEMFTKAEEAALYHRMKSGDEEARNMLIESQLAWIRLMVNKFGSKCSLQLNEFDDAESVSRLHFLHILDNKWNPERGRLTTLLSIAIPRCLQRWWNGHYLIKTPRCGPERCGFPDAMHIARSVTSIHADPDIGIKAKQIPFYDPDNGERMDKSEALGKIAAASKGLPKRSRDILERRMGGESLSSIGAVYKISKERVRQIERDSILYIQGKTSR